MSDHADTERDARPDIRFTVVAAAALGLVLMGDALIYVVLPLYPETFGVGTTAIGVLLAANRVIRILGYGWVGPLARRFGANVLAAAACAAGAISTIAYGVATGFPILLVARLAPSATPQGTGSPQCRRTRHGATRASRWGRSSAPWRLPLWVLGQRTRCWLR